MYLIPQYRVRVSDTNNGQIHLSLPTYNYIDDNEDTRNGIAVYNVT